MHLGRSCTNPRRIADEYFKKLNIREPREPKKPQGHTQLAFENQRRHVMHTRRAQLIAAAALALIVTVATGGVPHGQSPAPMPAQFDSDIKAHVKLTPEKQKQLLAGQPVMQLLESDPAKEVAIFGAVWVAAPIARYVDAVKNIEEFEKGRELPRNEAHQQPTQARRLQRLSLPPEDLDDLKTCKVGDCELKLGEAALVRIQKTTTGRSRPRRPTWNEHSEGWPSSTSPGISRAGTAGWRFTGTRPARPSSPRSSPRWSIPCRP